MTTTRPKSTSPVPSSGDGKNGTPSGFVLKLYQMVNGAPDDIVSVSASNCSLICLILEESGFALFEGGVTKPTLLRINVIIWACRNAMVYPLSPWMLIRLSEHMMCMSLYVHILMFYGHQWILARDVIVRDINPFSSRTRGHRRAFHLSNDHLYR